MKKTLAICIALSLIVPFCSCASLQAELADAIEDAHGVEGKSKEEHQEEYKSEWVSFFGDFKKLFQLLSEDNEEENPESESEVNNDEPLLDDLRKLIEEGTTTPDDDAPEEEPESAEDIEYNNKVNDFLSSDEHKSGASWGAGKTPDKSSHDGTGCNAYAADFAKVVFNHDSPRTEDAYTDADEIRDGDIIYVNEEYETGKSKPHWLVVISRDGEQLTTTEGNWDGKVVSSDSKYTVKDGVIYINGKPFRKIVEAYHHK